MATVEDLHALETELERVVDRLNGMPLYRAATATGACYDVAEEILTRTREIDRDVPMEAALPTLEPHGLGSLLAVIGRDYVKAAKAASQADVTPVTDRLIELRRSLP